MLIFSSCAIEALTSFMWNSSGMMDREEKQHRNNMTVPKSCSAPGLGTGLSWRALPIWAPLECSPTVTTSGSGLPSHRKHGALPGTEQVQPELGMVIPAAKAGVHRGLLVTRTGYFLPFNGPTKRKNDPNAVPSPSGPSSLILFATR